jgi:hypothetical protein
MSRAKENLVVKEIIAFRAVNFTTCAVFSLLIASDQISDRPWKILWSFNVNGRRERERESEWVRERKERDDKIEKAI